MAEVQQVIGGHELPGGAAAQWRGFGDGWGRALAGLICLPCMAPSTAASLCPQCLREATLPGMATLIFLHGKVAFAKHMQALPQDLINN